MIIVMKPHVPREEVDRIIGRIRDMGLEPVPLFGVERTVIAVIGDSRKYEIDCLKANKSIEKITKILKPYKLASREYKDENSVIKVGDCEIGGEGFSVIAGPCAVENESQIMKIGEILKNMGIKIMRASACTRSPKRVRHSNQEHPHTVSRGLESRG